MVRSYAYQTLALDEGTQLPALITFTSRKKSSYYPLDKRPSRFQNHSTQFGGKKNPKNFVHSISHHLTDCHHDLAEKICKDNQIPLMQPHPEKK
jgi:hypothetical protein